MDANVSEGPSLAQVMAAIRQAEILCSKSEVPTIGELTECLRKQDVFAGQAAAQVYRVRLAA